MKCPLISNFDICTEVLSYIGDPKDLQCWNTVCSYAHTISKLCHVNISICRRQLSWVALSEWLCRYPRIASVEIHMSNCSYDLLKCLVESIKMSPSPHRITLSMTKCFAIKEDASMALDACKKVALCDLVFTTTIIQPTQLAQLKVLILSNCTFHISTLSMLWRHFPEHLTLIGLGGSHGVTTFETEESSPCLRSNLVIETTFLPKQDKDFLTALFPSSYHMDLTTDSLGYIETCFNIGGISNDRHLRSALLSCSNSQNQTPLHLACWCSQSDRIRWLVKQGARADLKDTRGSTPLHRASVPYGRRYNTCHDSDTAESVRCLIEALPAMCFVRNHQLEAPLYTAALTGNHIVLSEMIRCIQNTKMPIRNDSFGLLSVAESTVIDHAKCTGKCCVLSQSTSDDIDAHCSDDRGFSLLHAAVMNGSFKCCEILLQSKISCPNRQNQYGSTPLHLAYRHKSNEIVNLLISNGGLLDIEDDVGNTPEQYKTHGINSRSKKSNHKQSKKHKGNRR